MLAKIIVQAGGVGIVLIVSFLMCSVKRFKRWQDLQKVTLEEVPKNGEYAMAENKANRP